MRSAPRRRCGEMYLHLIWPVAAYRCARTLQSQWYNIVRADAGDVFRRVVLEAYVDGLAIHIDAFEFSSAGVGDKVAVT